MLLLKECKKIARTFVYLIFSALVILDFLTQFQNDLFPDNTYCKPVEGVGYYGEICDPHPELIMPAATKSLLNNYLNNQFTTYPFGFYRSVKLNSEKSRKIMMILEKLTGQTDQELRAAITNEPESTYDNGISETYFDYRLPELDIQVDYDTFLLLMEETDSILGGGSFYAPASLERTFGMVDMTYEQAAAEYDSFVRLDHVTNGYARLWCDYHGLILGILPVFLVAAFCTLDRRSKADAVIHSRKTGSFRIILVRFLALILMVMLPVLLTAVWGDLLVTRFYPDMQLDHFAMYKYMLIWIVPELIGVIGIDMLITEVFSGITAILLQFVWWFHECLTTQLSGDFSVFHLLLRHNTFHNREIFMNQLNLFIQNRCFIAGLGIVCMLLTILIYHLKREGKFHGFRVLHKLFAHQSRA